MAIQTFGRWPFRRQIFKEVFTNLKKAGVKLIGFDVIFSEPERASIYDVIEVSDANSGSKKKTINLEELEEFAKVSPGDKIFAEAISEFENVVLGYLYFLTKNEVKMNGRDKNPFQGLEDMEDSAVFGNPFGDKEDG